MPTTRSRGPSVRARTCGTGDRAARSSLPSRGSASSRATGPGIPRSPAGSSGPMRSRASPRWSRRGSAAAPWCCSASSRTTVGRAWPRGRCSSTRWPAQRRAEARRGARRRRRYRVRVSAMPAVAGRDGTETRARIRNPRRRGRGIALGLAPPPSRRSPRVLARRRAGLPYSPLSPAAFSIPGSMSATSSHANVRAPVAALASFIAVLHACAAPAPTPEADLLIVNARVYTLAWGEPTVDGTPAEDAPYDPATGWRPDAEAVAVRDGRILFGGAREGAERFRGERTQVIDAAGGTLVPGLIDAHVHLANLGESLAQVSLVGVQSEAEAVERVAARAAEVPAGEWIIGYGWDEAAWAGRYPDH